MRLDSGSCLPFLVANHAADIRINDSLHYTCVT
jgi:hypothetical protein